MIVRSNKIFLKEDKTLEYLYFIDRNHPLANSQGKVYYHRYILSLKIGHWLLFNEHTHHINGNRKNNNQDNLLLVTKSHHTKIHHCYLKERKCLKCYKLFRPPKSKSKYCSNKCVQEVKKKINISKEELQKAIWKRPTTLIAKELGVSDSAIGKICRKYGIKKPGRGYWIKHVPVA